MQQDALEKFWRWQVRRPRLVMVIALVPALVALGVLLAVRPLQLDPSQRAFRVIDDRDIDNYESFLVARQAREDSTASKSLLIVYHGGSDGDGDGDEGVDEDMIRPDRLELVREVEARIRAHPSFLRYCRLRRHAAEGPAPPGNAEEVDPQECELPESFVNFLYPSADTQASPDGQVSSMDGWGASPVANVTRAMQLLLIAGRDGFFNALESLDHPASDSLVSMFTFGRRRRNGSGQDQDDGGQDAADRIREAEEEELDRILADLEPILEEYDQPQANGGFRVLREGGGVVAVQLRGIAIHDALWAAGSLAALFLAMWLFTCSGFLAAMSVVHVAASGLPVMLLYWALFGARFELTNVVSVWLLAGIALDQLLAVHGLFRAASAAVQVEGQVNNAARRRVRLARDPRLDSKRQGGQAGLWVSAASDLEPGGGVGDRDQQIRAGLESIYRRLEWAMERAIPGLLITSGVAMMAFSASTLSHIQVLRHFGVLMGLLIASNTILVVLFWPACLTLHCGVRESVQRSFCQVFGFGSHRKCCRPQRHAPGGPASGASRAPLEARPADPTEGVEGVPRGRASCCDQRLSSLRESCCRAYTHTILRLALPTLLACILCTVALVAFGGTQLQRSREIPRTFAADTNVERLRAVRSSLRCTTAGLCHQGLDRRTFPEQRPLFQPGARGVLTCPAEICGPAATGRAADAPNTTLAASGHCELSPWLPMTGCSRLCDGGLQVWRRFVEGWPGDPLGQPCPAAESPHRLRMIACNTRRCLQDLYLTMAPIGGDNDGERSPASIHPRLGLGHPVYLVWGLRPGFEGGSPPLWETDPLRGWAARASDGRSRRYPRRDPGFDLSHPESQVLAVQACEALMQAADAGVLAVRCPPLAFRNWLQRSSSAHIGDTRPSYPISDPALFTAWFQFWLISTPEGAMFADLVDLDRETGEVAWVAVEASGLRGNADEFPWVQRFMQQLNNISPAHFQGFQTSARWPQVKIGLALDHSLVAMVVAFSVLLAVVCLVATLRRGENVWLACLAVVSSLGSLGGTLACVGLLGLAGGDRDGSFGVLELIAITVSLGWCSLLSLRVVHGFAAADKLSPPGLPQQMPGGASVAAAEADAQARAPEKLFPNNRQGNRQRLELVLPLMVPPSVQAALASSVALALLLPAETHALATFGRATLVGQLFGLVYGLVVAPALLLLVGHRRQLHRELFGRLRACYRRCRPQPPRHAEDRDQPAVAAAADSRGAPVLPVAIREEPKNPRRHREQH